MEVDPPDHLAAQVSLIDKLTELQNPDNSVVYDPAPSRGKPAPKGWEPGVVWNGDGGTGISRAHAESEDIEHADLLQEWGFDPETHHLENLQYRRWEANVGGGEVQWMRYYKADIKRGSQVDADVEELKNFVVNWAPSSVSTRVPESGGDAFCVFLADWQIGKGEGGGSGKTAERLLVARDMAVERIEELRHIGRPLETLYLFGLGDLFEQCDGYYPMQAFQTDLNMREQRRIVRRILLQYIRTLCPLFHRVVVTGVGGNHGENRRDGKAYTDFSDNDDVAVIESVAEICAENETMYGNVSFLIPDDHLCLTVNAGGQNLAIAHGHQFSRGGRLPQAKAEEWWRGQTMGWQPASQADILVSGHYHHFTVSTFGTRTHIQVPAMDGGSKWFRDKTGNDSPPGLLTMRTHPGGFEDLQILSPGA